MENLGPGSACPRGNSEPLEHLEKLNQIGLVTWREKPRPRTPTPTPKETTLPLVGLYPEAHESSAYSSDEESC